MNIITLWLSADAQLVLGYRTLSMKLLKIVDGSAKFGHEYTNYEGSPEFVAWDVALWF